MPIPDRERLGRLVFDAYLKAYREIRPDQYGMIPMMGWEEVPEDVREASRRAAEAVAKQVTDIPGRDAG